MSVVDVNGNLLVEVIHAAVNFHVAHNDIADRSRAHKVLLAKTESLAPCVVVVRVENLRDGVRDIVCAESLGVVARVERVHIEGHCLRAPQTQLGNTLAVVARNEHIIRHSIYAVVADIIEAVIVVLPALVDVTVEANLNSLVMYGNKPSAAARKPVVGKLGLPAVNDFLLEDTVFIKDRIACCGIIAGSQTVHIASCKSAKTAVSETCVGFFLENSVDFYAKLVKSRSNLVLKTEIVKGSLEGASHKELHRQVINLLSAVGVALVHKVVTLLFHIVHNDSGKRAVNLSNVRFLCVGSVIIFQNGFKLF